RPLASRATPLLDSHPRARHRCSVAGAPARPHMHVLFVIDPLPSLKAYKDSSVAMMRALTARGHTLSVALQGDLYIDGAVVKAQSQPLRFVEGVHLHQPNWWVGGALTDAPLSGFDAVLMRKDPPFDMEYFYSTHLLEYAQKQGARVFNSGSALR